MNGQYHRWTMEQTGTGEWREKNFVTDTANPDLWTFTDRQHNGERITWKRGMELEMRPGEEDEIVGHPRRVQITGFDVGTVGVRGGVTVKARVLEASPLSRGSYDAGKEVSFDSELARGAYRIPVRDAALTA